MVRFEDCDHNILSFAFECHEEYSIEVGAGYLFEVVRLEFDFKCAI